MLSIERMVENGKWIHVCTRFEELNIVLKELEATYPVIALESLRVKRFQTRKCPVCQCEVVGDNRKLARHMVEHQLNDNALEAA